MPLRTVIFDNGAGAIKAGFSDQDVSRIVENCVIKAKSERKRVFIGEQFAECNDRSSLFLQRPFQKGYLVNWDPEQQIWDYVMGAECLNADPSNCRVIFTEPCFNFVSIQEAIDEVLFEYYGFSQAHRTTAGQLSCLNYCRPSNKSCCLVVDSGFSFTHLMPYANGKPLWDAVVRVDIGGKALTNQLKEVISYRQLQVMEETYVMNRCKEHSCYVAADFMNELCRAQAKESRSEILREYVLPDFTNIPQGFLRKPGEAIPNVENINQLQILKLNQERFSIPELLFCPSDVGIHQMGISEAIVYTITNKTPKEMHGQFFANLLLTGGNCMFNGIRSRIENDVRSMAPDVYDVNVVLPSKPIEYAWHGGVKLANLDQSTLNHLFVSKKEYDEHGSVICSKKFRTVLQ